jgi:hypothetical protein
MNRSIFLISLVLLLAISLISSIGDNNVPPTPSGNFVDPNIPKIDYNSPLTYNDASFWGSGTDYDLVNWDQVQFNQIPWDNVDQGQIPADYINKIPVNKINVETVSDRTKITSEQWEHEDNLNKAGDLSQYPSAQEAVFDKHSGFQKIDLVNGHTEYKDGILSNGPIEINLNDEKIKGTELTALEGGGFSIGKGESSKFEWDDNKFDLEGAEKPIEINSLYQIVLPNGGKMVSYSGTKIDSLDDKTIIWPQGSSLNIQGIATFSDAEYDGFVGQSGDIKQTGFVTIDYMKNGEDRYDLRNTALYRSKGFNYEQVGKKASADNMFLADATYFQNVLNSHPGVLENGMPGLEKRWQDVLPGLAKDAAKNAAMASLNYMKENPEKVVGAVQKNIKTIQRVGSFLFESGPGISDAFTGETRFGFGHGGAGVIAGDAGIYVGMGGKVTGVYDIDKDNSIEIFRNPNGVVGSAYRYNKGKLHAFAEVTTNENFNDLPQFQGGLRTTFK